MLHWIQGDVERRNWRKWALQSLGVEQIYELWNPGLPALIIRWGLWTTSPWVARFPQPTWGPRYKQWPTETTEVRWPTACIYNCPAWTFILCNRHGHQSRTPEKAALGTDWSLKSNRKNVGQSSDSAVFWSPDSQNALEWELRPWDLPFQSEREWQVEQSGASPGRRKLLLWQKWLWVPQRLFRAHSTAKKTTHRRPGAGVDMHSMLSVDIDFERYLHTSICFLWGGVMSGEKSKHQKADWSNCMSPPCVFLQVSKEPFPSSSIHVLSLCLLDPQPPIPLPHPCLSHLILAKLALTSQVRLKYGGCQKPTRNTPSKASTNSGFCWTRRRPWGLQRWLGWPPDHR